MAAVVAVPECKTIVVPERGPLCQRPPLSVAKAARVKQQVEFYFSASNLPRDKFLRAQVEKDEQGFVDIALLCSFTRMASILCFVQQRSAAEIEEDLIQEVAEILRKSEMLTVSEDGKRVRRTVALPPYEQVTAEVDERTLFAKPFPFDVTLETLTSFFRSISPVNCVRMRRHVTSKDFRGSLFVEFDSVEAAKKVAEMNLIYEGAPLHFEFAKAFKEREAQERHDRPNSPYQIEGTATGTANGAHAPEQSPGLAPETPDAQKPTPGDAAVSVEGGESKEGETAEVAAAAAVPEAKPEPEETLEWDPCCIVRFTFREAPAEDVSFVDIKQALGGKDAGVLYVEYTKGDKSGCTRFRTAELAAIAVGNSDPPATLDVKGQLVDLLILEGEEEVAFYKRALVAKKEKERREASEGQGGGRGRGWGRGRGRGRFSGNKHFMGHGRGDGNRAKRGRY